MASIRLKRGSTTNGTNGYAPVKTHDPQTDYSRWRLRDDRGRQTWHYLESDEELKRWPMTTADKYFLGLDTVRHSLLEFGPSC